jgi:hypothetical protein
MMVHTRKAQILERQMTEFLYRLFDLDLAALDLLQQLFYLLNLNFSSLVFRPS